MQAWNYGKGGMAELAAILTLDPIERAALKKKAAALRAKERRATIFAEQNRMDYH